MKHLTNFPVKHIARNLIFNRNKTVWAWYEIEGYQYDHLDDDQKDIPLNSQITFLTKNAYDLHFLLIPFQSDTENIINKTLESLEGKDFPLKESGRDYLLQLKEKVTQGAYNKEKNQFNAYVGVQLNPRMNRYKRGNTGTNMIGALKGIFEGMNAPIRKAVGFDPYDIPKDEIDAYLEQAQTLEREVARAFNSNARSISTGESLFLCEYNFTLSMEEQTVNTMDLAEIVKGETEDGKPMEAIRPNKDAYYEIQNAKFDAYDGRTLKLEKVVNDEIETELVSFLVIDKIQPVNHHPGFEWIYRLQTDLGFPVGLSIRAFHRPNSHIQKELSDSLQQFEDQTREAEGAGATAEKNVRESNVNAIQMQSVFQKSGDPVYNCSFVIRVTAPNIQVMKVRINAIRDQLDTDRMSVIAPYGETFNSMAEFFPGSPRQSNDYFHIVAPDTLAGMMFGATANIGDNRGFLIGFTNKFRKPVFIQPDLAAKDFEGVKKITSSLAVMVTGETGNGKSVFMNLYAYLAALTQGSQVLIIDPKGDRKNWVEGLPNVDPKHIGVWTLGKDKKDAGSLDPFRTSVTVEEGKTIWLDIASYLIGINLENPKYSLLSEAIEVASEHTEPCGEVIIQQLEYMHISNPGNISQKRLDDLEDLISSLKTIRRDSLSSLLFGKVGQDYNTLSVDKTIQVVMIENFQMPSGENWREESNRASVRISEGLLLSLTAFTKQFIHQTPKTKHKVIMSDEAKTLSRSKMGREMVDWLETNGRYFNASSMKGTQNATDHTKATNIGMKFTFRLPQRKEAIQALEYYNLPETEENIHTLQNLAQGECLFQDIYGRTAVIYINPIFRQIMDAFRTDTATEKEREAERLRQERQAQEV